MFDLTKEDIKLLEKHDAHWILGAKCIVERNGMARLNGGIFFDKERVNNLLKEHLSALHKIEKLEELLRILEKYIIKENLPHPEVF